MKRSRIWQQQAASEGVLCLYFIVRLCRYQLIKYLTKSLPIIIYCSVKYNVSVSWLMAWIFSEIRILKCYSRTVMRMSGSQSN
jgi:hypothetical protein